MSRDLEETDRALIAKVEGRDADALARLYDRHSARLMGLALKILGDAGEAEEVLQEVFLFAWRMASTYDPGRGPVLAWLLVATRSRSIDRLRSRRPEYRDVGRREGEPERAISLANVEADVASREWDGRCREAIAELPEDQRKALELAYFQGLTHREIAEATGKPLGTVKTKIRLGLMKLRERLGPYRKSEGHGT
jgi:RNA polymerase sigma-70 factor, ECF subfamily